ncbi:efflux RND transporter periplasmic adaptor subunit [Brevibacillus sp. SYSU BS000544]|uniref:efflux RND transporter periplasmic adaptor subunit n=1 Tax=Brevibacillus sp. SYSU BS000544 TaxID=3416443 RepID=UPI003CE47DEF
MSKKKWIIMGSIVLVLVGGFFGWKYWESKSVAEEQVPEQKVEMPTAMADKGEVKKTIYATGTVEAKEYEEVKPELSAKVEKLLVKEGQSVQKGDVLFTFDSEDAELQYQKLEISLAKTEQEIRKLAKRLPEIKSDKQGKVKEVMVKVGDEVTPNTVLAKIIDVNHLKINGRFFGTQANNFKKGQKVRVFLRNSLTFVEGEVIELDSVGQNVEKNGILFDVTVLVKKVPGIVVGDPGQVEYRSPSGEVVMSHLATKFEAPEEIDLIATTEGKVAKVLIDKEDEIKAGQLVIEMDTESNEMDLKEKEISLKQARLELMQKRRDISKKQVTASVSGVVTKVNVKEGNNIDGSKPAMVILNMSEVFMKASVDEVDIPYIQENQTVDVYVTAFGNQVFTGKVIKIPQEGTTQDKTVRFEVKIAIQDGGKIKHGMTGDCDINVNKVENVVRLPVNAVEVLEDGKGTVMVKDPKSGEPTPKQVEIGVEGAEFIEIKSGIKEGEEVLLMGV